MIITYKDEKNIDEKNLENIFNPLDWLSTKDTKILKRALSLSTDVFTAWDENKLVGIVKVIADGGITVHVHYLVVLPEYRNNGIGTKLMNMVIEKYKDYVRLYIESRPEKVEYYEKEFDFKKQNFLVLMKKDLQGRKKLDKYDK